jgi:hypothetical protein
MYEEKRKGDVGDTTFLFMLTGTFSFPGQHFSFKSQLACSTV